ncbi:MAG: HNH endonuclease [Acidithiobacillus ferrivorans]
MKFKDYIDALPSHVSDVKLTILKKLWHTDSSGFPKPWVSSAELLELTGQKYFDRRARELRDQIGCDIETMHKAELGGHAWRIKSTNLAAPQDREYLSQAQKIQLFAAARSTCSICGKITEPGVRGLQADHKVPVSRGGTNAIENWQAICNHCNVGKRRVCEGCTIECTTCSWAYPEIVGINTLISINEKVLSKITEYSKAANKTASHVFEEAAIYFIESNKK